MFLLGPRQSDEMEGRKVTKMYPDSARHLLTFLLFTLIYGTTVCQIDLNLKDVR